MKVHPAAATFSRMTQPEVDELALDIAAHGLREAIKTDHAGELLVDGRNRERACETACVSPLYERLPADTDIFAYVVLANLHRRHLTDGQRRDIVWEIAKCNPTLSDRQIGKLANMSHQSVGRALDGTGGPGGPAGQRTTGGDGKSRPAATNRRGAARVTALASYRALEASEGNWGSAC